MNQNQNIKRPIKGLTIIPNFITKDEEKELIREIEKIKFIMFYVADR